MTTRVVTCLLGWFAGVSLIVISAPELFAADQGSCNGAVQCLNPYNCPTGICCSATRWKGCTVTGPNCGQCNQQNNTCNGQQSKTCLCGDAPQSPCRLCYTPSQNSGTPGTVQCINENCNGPNQFCNTDWIWPYQGGSDWRYTCECQP